MFKVIKRINRNRFLQIIIYAIVLLSSLFFTLIFFMKSLNFEEKVLNYKENGILNYKVYLKENDFYPNDYLDKDMIYVSSLIDYIDIDFNYKFQIDENIDADFIYKILGKLIILDESGKKTYFTKEYNLLSSTKKSLNNENNLNILENIQINYDYYNNIANKFKTDFGVDTLSYLRVYLTVQKNNEEEMIKFDNAISEIYIDIPLSEKSINIAIDYSNLNQSKSFVKEQKSLMDNLLYIILTTICILVSIVVLSKILYLIVKIFNANKNSYDKYINKVLKEYDRLIADTNHCPEFSEYKLIMVSNFKELVDVRDNLKKPIMHYVVKQHFESYFYIIDDMNLYLVRVTNENLEGMLNEKNI